MKTNARPCNEALDFSRAPYYVRALALGFAAILLGLQIGGWRSFVPVILGGRADFRSFYAAGYMVRTGAARQLYDYEAEKAYQDSLISREDLALPFIHPAYEALLFAPFSFLGYRAAYFAFLLFNLSLLAICYQLLRPHLQNLAAIWAGLPAAMFLFLPIGGTLMQGQDSIILLTLLTAAVVCLSNKKGFTAGTLVGLGLFRFQIIVAISLLFIVWRRWRFCSGFAVSTAAVGSLSLAMTGISQAGSYARSLLSLSGSGSVADLIRYAQPDWQMANIRGLLVGIVGSHLSITSTRILICAVSGVILILVAWLTPHKQDTDLFLVAITTSAVVSYHLLFHDLCILVIPIALALNRFAGAEVTNERCARFALRVAFLTFLAPMMISLLPSLFYLVALPMCIFLLVLIERVRKDAPAGTFDLCASS